MGGPKALEVGGKRELSYSSKAALRTLPSVKKDIEHATSGAGQQ